MIRRLLPLLALIPAAAQAGAPAQLNWRYDEDWSQVRDAGAKHIALDLDDDAWISLGVEARARQESFSGNYWGSAAAPDDGYLWLRLMPHVDVHAGPARVFVQGIVGKARGLQPAAGPADETGIDLLQGFGDIALPLGDHATLTLRAGRELMPLGAERLIGTRYGPNIPQPFDGVRAILSTGGVRIDSFHMRPVAVGPGDFDDRTSDTKRLDGVYTSFAVAAGVKIDAYWLDYRNKAASFEQGRGHEHRATFGTRFSGKRGALSWNWEAMLQRGHFGGAGIRAWSIASETGYAFDALPLKPQFRLRANVASGDRDPTDNRLESFNALFPKGKYFGELSPIGPINIINLHPSVDLDLGDGFGLGVAGIAYWRQSKGDGIYDVPGQLVRRGALSDRRFVGTQGELLLSWQPTPTLSYGISYSLFRPGGFVRDSGAARDIHMLGLEAMFRV